MEIKMNIDVSWKEKDYFESLFESPFKKEPDEIMFTTSEGDRFYVNVREFNGMLDISCEGGFIIQPLEGNRLLLGTIKP